MISRHGQRLAVEKYLDKHSVGWRPGSVIDVIPPSNTSRKKEWVIPTSEELAVLRKKALKSATMHSKGKRGRLPGMQYERSPKIRRYVIGRSKGICEYCEQPARYFTDSGEPILESHHIFLVSLGGPDSPEYVVALHPDCHRAAHRSKGRKEINQRCLEIVRQKEAA